MRVSAAFLIGVLLCVLFNSATFFVFHGFNIQNMVSGGIVNPAEYRMQLVIVGYLCSIIPALIVGTIARNHGWYLGGLCILIGTALYGYAMSFYLHSETYITASGGVYVEDAYSISFNIPYLLRSLIVGAVSGHLGQRLVRYKRSNAGSTP